jgi:hypothetical protein
MATIGPDMLHSSKERAKPAAFVLFGRFRFPPFASAAGLGTGANFG